MYAVERIKMEVSEGKAYWMASIEIPLWIFNEWKDLYTLYFDENCNELEDDAEGTIWVIYQDQHTLLLASEYYLKNHVDKDKKNCFDSMRRMFNTKARIFAGCIFFEFNTYCGIKKKELERGVCFIENGFVKIGLRN